MWGVLQTPGVVFSSRKPTFEGVKPLWICCIGPARLKEDQIDMTAREDS